ncbi:hypothetical protein BJ138DRAFT_1117723, partial [Hygrophoropsis aurantiaca]
AVGRARREGRDVRVLLAVVPTVSSLARVVGAKVGVDVGAKAGVGAGAKVGADVGRDGSAGAGGVEDVNVTSAPIPVPPAIWASRFVGGWGEAFYGHPSASRDGRGGVDAVGLGVDLFGVGGGVDIGGLSSMNGNVGGMNVGGGGGGDSLPGGDDETANPNIVPPTAHPSLVPPAVHPGTGPGTPNPGIGLGSVGLGLGMGSIEEAEDDGRGVVSAGWGWGHDGSAFEVVRVEVVEKTASHTCLRTRAQRLAEYAERRAAVLGTSLPTTSTTAIPSSASSSPLLDVTNGRKRRRVDPAGFDLGPSLKLGLKLPFGGSALPCDPPFTLPCETQWMQARTVVFGPGVGLVGAKAEEGHVGVEERQGGSGVGFKYDPRIVADVLFTDEAGEGYGIRPPARKRRKTTSASRAGSVSMPGGNDNEAGDTNTPRNEDDAEPESDSLRAVVLEGPEGAFVLGRACPRDGEDGKRYVLAEVVAVPAIEYAGERTEENMGETTVEGNASGTIAEENASGASVARETGDDANTNTDTNVNATTSANAGETASTSTDGEAPVPAQAETADAEAPAAERTAVNAEQAQASGAAGGAAGGDADVQMGAVVVNETPVVPSQETPVVPPNETTAAPLNESPASPPNENPTENPPSAASPSAPAPTSTDVPVSASEGGTNQTESSAIQRHSYQTPTHTHTLRVLRRNLCEGDVRFEAGGVVICGGDRIGEMATEAMDVEHDRDEQRIKVSRWKWWFGEVPDA